MEFRHDCFWIVRILRIVVSNRKLINPYFITQKHNWHDLSVWEKKRLIFWDKLISGFFGPAIGRGEIYLEPKWPLFWLEFRPCFGGLTFTNRGHLGSRYIHTSPKVPHLRNAKVPSYSPYLWNPSQRKPRKLWVRVSATVCFIREAGQNNAPIGCKRAPS